MHIHILGICGTFMGGIAALAKAAGHEVSGCDAGVYPPMSNQLKKLGIDIHEGFDAAQLKSPPDCVVVGNVVSRGFDVVEAMLDRDMPYQSGPQWLAENVLRGQHVLAVAGTHGKTTTASLLAWILEDAGLQPGFLIGGIPANFGVSARFGGGNCFVVEADEYDTAFFDKRAKFVHYHPRTLAITNLEYDHADIYADLDAIIWQFHQLIRTVPNEGLVTVQGGNSNIETLLERGVWTPVETFSAGDSAATWSAKYDLIGVKSRFSVAKHGQEVGQTDWALLGQHNLENALAAISVAVHAGVSVDVALEALSQFQGVRRRLDKRAVIDGITLYDDFAHHPTAISKTLEAVRSQKTDQRIIAVVEPRSNTMRLGVHRDTLRHAFDDADRVFVLSSDDLSWNPESVLASLGAKLSVALDAEVLLDLLLDELEAGDQVVFMSNGDFKGLPRLLQQALKSDRPSAARA